MPRLSLFKHNIDSIIAAAAGFTIIYFFTRHSGIGVEPDSVVYLSTAQNLHDHGKLHEFTGGHLVDFPAGYPVFLSSVIFLTGLKPLLFAPIMNASFFAIIIFLAGYIMEQFVQRSKWYKWAMLTCIVISPALLDVYSMLMSESLFLIAEMFFFIAAFRYTNSFSKKALIAMALSSALAPVTRYAGITVIITGGLLILFNVNLTRRKKLLDLFLYFLFSSTPLLVNVSCNYMLSGSTTGGRELSNISLWQSMHDAGSVLYDWLPFLMGHYKGAGVLFLILMAGLLLHCRVRYRRNKILSTYEDITTLFCIVYLLFLVIIASISRFETLYSRLLAPIFIPLLWACSYWWVPFLRRARGWTRVIAFSTAIVVFILFQYGQYVFDYETWDGVKDAGIPGYAEDQWTLSPTVQFMQKEHWLFQKAYTVYSDASDAVYFFTGNVGKFLPHKAYIPGIRQFINEPHCYVIWFDDGENPDLVDKNFITNVKKMKLVKQLPDGAIYSTENDNIP